MCMFFLAGDEAGGPVSLSLSGCSPLTCPARVALPVATLPPA